MGYTTTFDGSIKFNKPVTEELKDYINRFSSTRRMKRDNDKIKALYPNWKDLCFNGELGLYGEYLAVEDKFNDESIVDYNSSCPQPGLWCQWIINDNDELVWDEGEKFYNYVDWLNYLISHFFRPSGYILNGAVDYQGEDPSDFGRIVVVDNEVMLKEGEVIYGMDAFGDDELIEEPEKRGYMITEREEKKCLPV